MPREYDRDRYQRRVGALKTERQHSMPEWEDLADFIAPTRGQFRLGKKNAGRTRFSKIINGKAGKALQTATAGMFNGTMSPVRPWVVLEDPDPGLMEFGPVKEWLFAVSRGMLRLLSDSNLYQTAPVMIREQLLFATGCMYHEDDPLSVAHFSAPTIGSYMIAQNDRGTVDTIAREFEMTVEQIVSQFSSDGQSLSKNISQIVRDAYDKGNYDSWYPVVHFVHPNPSFEPDSDAPLKRRFRSVHYEPGNRERDVFMRKSGFYEFPFYCPRWGVTGLDVYGSECPGMTALGDVKQLQLEERRKAQGLDKMVSPILQAPPGLNNVPWQNLPGHTAVFDAGGDQRGLRPAYEVNLPLQELTLDMKEVENRINEAFFVDLFKAITAMQGIQPRNELELLQRHQERLMELGPVLQRQYHDFLDQLIERTFNQMLRAGRSEDRPFGLLPPPPEELQGRPLRPRYVSTLALAQDASTIQSIERFFAYVSNVAGIYPEARHKFDAMQSVDSYGRLVGVPPELVVPDQQANEAAQAEAQAQQAAQAAQLGQQGAEMARAASQADLEGDNVASRIVSNATGG